MAGGAQQDGEEIVGINVTPLVDVMMVLLIIFMVTANVINQKAIAIELPKASTGEDSASTKNLAFVVDHNGDVFLDGKPIDLNNLAAELDVARHSGQKLQALVGADKDAPYKAVVKVIDLLRKNGVNDFALNVQAE